MKRFIPALCAFLCLMLAVSCRTTSSITNEENLESKGLYVVKTEIDTFYIDRVHYEYIDGETIRIVDSVMVISKVYVHDTTAMTDTITQIKTEYVERVVEKPKYVWWPCAAVAGFLVALWLFILFKKKHL